MGLLNLGGPIAQFERNDSSISPVEVISLSDVRTPTLLAAVALVFSIGYEDGIAAVAPAQSFFILCQHEAEHHLQANQQRMEVPNNGGFVQ